MKSKFIMLVLFFISSFAASVFADDIRIQQALNTGKANLSIVQDKDGLLWIGTADGGLFCYDGNKVERAKITENGNPNKIISSIFIDKEETIWFFAIAEGLYSYDKNSGLCKQYKSGARNQNSLTSDKAYWSPSLITEDERGLIWIGTADGLNSYDKNTGKFTQYRHNPDNPDSLSNNSVWTVFADKDGLVWVGTENGLNRYDKNTGRFYCYKHDPNNLNSLSDNFIYVIKEDKESNLWIGTKNAGIDKFNKKTGTFTNYRHNPQNSNSLSHNEIVHIMVDKFDDLWICNEGGTGVDRFNSKTNTFTHYRHDPKNTSSISSNNIIYSFEDNAGIIWLVDYLEKINKCTRKKDIIKTYSSDKEFSGITLPRIVGIYEDSNNNIWFGSYKGGLFLCTKDGKVENIKPDASNPLSLPSNSIYSILDASNGKIWLGIYGGFVTLFDVNKKQVVKNFKNPYSTDTPRNLTKDNKKSHLIWFASPFSGLFTLDTISGKFVQYRHIPNRIDSLSSSSVLSILQDDNTLWIGTGGGGLNVFDKTTGKCTCYRHNPNDKNSISGNFVIRSFIDSKGNFWLTTDGGGLNKFDRHSGQFNSYGVECGFPSNSTRHILEDNEGYLWISTDAGIVKFDPIKLKVVKLLSKADGLPDSQFNMRANALKDSNGNFWFSTFRGLCKFNPEKASKIEANPYIPPIVLSTFKSKEGTYNENGLKKLTKIKLPWPDNSFSFTFAALDYMDPSKNQYAYKLEGFDKDWNYIGTNNFGQYSNLNPGEYTLRLKGSNNDGIWNEEGISIKITITPPYWMTSWFKGLIGIAILSIIGGVFQLRVSSLKKKAIHIRNHALAETTAQVVHDIRSPLAALNTALKSLKELSEQERILIRNATNRISDIANNLLVKYKVKGKEDTEEQKYLKAELVSSLLDHLISEKRVQITEKPIELILELGNNTHSCFVNLEPENFKRVISNLINNAFEAIETSGVIQVVLAKETDNELTVKIIDNGTGIPEDILLKIKQGIVTSSKKKGHGIGISSAIQNIKSWGGSYNIQSKEGEGTTFTIKLPITKEPDWFQSSITFSPNTHIVILDDDESIHNIWQARFYNNLENKLVTLEHFYEPSAFREYCLTTRTCPAEAKSEGGSHTKAGKTSRSKHDLFLVDHELINSRETGLDLIEQLDLKDQAILVTSRYEESEIRERIRTLGIKIIPKNFAPYIPTTCIQ